MALPRRIPKEKNRSERWRSPALASLLEYKAGRLFWKSRPREMFADQRSYSTWNARFAGKEAFTTTTSEGYKAGTIFGRREYAHRVIWALMFDVQPTEIDHINGDRSDNRVENLRDIDRLENRKNVKRPSTNVSGVVGVSFKKNRWEARIQVNGIDIYLGRFKDFADAVDARKSAEAAFNFHPNHGRV